jgi:hypothetical protein
MTKGFARFARKAGLASDSLHAAAADVAAGITTRTWAAACSSSAWPDAAVVSQQGFGRSFCFKVGGHSFFAHGFAKNERANVSVKELKALKQLVAVYLGLSEDEVGTAVVAGELIEVSDDDREGEEQAG